jgi:Ca2+-binding EF-hand superfamily protein
MMNGVTAIDEKDNGDVNDSPGEPPLRTVSTSEDEGTKDSPGIIASSRKKSRNSNSNCNRSLDELIYDAARQCDNTMLQSFLEKMKHSGSSSREIRAGVMVFSDMDLNSKIKRIFDVLGDQRRGKWTSGMDETETNGGDEEKDEEKSLTRDGALSLFRAVIVAISSCIHKNAEVQIDMGKKQNGEQPEAKRRKPNTPEADWNKNIAPDNHDISSGTDSVPSLKAPTVSFDNSTIATLNKEDDDLEISSVRKEFEEIAIYATDRLIKYTQKKLGNIDKSSNLSENVPVVVTFDIFQSWRKAEGARIAPWLDLLNLSRWKTPQRSTERSAGPPQMHNQLQQPTKQKQGTHHTLSQPKLESEEINNSSLPTAKKSYIEGGSLDLVKRNEKSQDQLVPKKKSEDVTSMTNPLTQISCQTPLYVSNKASSTVLSFDFSGSLPEEEEVGDNTFCITITEENLKTFRSLVERTGLINRSSHEITTILLQASKDRDHEGEVKKVIPIERFHTCLHQLLGSGSTRRLSKIDRDIFSSCFVDFFGCFNSGIPPLESGEAFTYELAVGFCFLCAGNKSSKLATGFEMLEKQIGMGLTSNQLVRFLRSYLTMLAGISFLTSSSDGIMKPKLNATTRKLMYAAVENGARWTLGHFLKDVGLPEDDDSQARHTFESFASWYSNGGFNTAPWLELLDLKKLLSLVIGDDMNPKSSTLTHDALPIFPGQPKTTSPEFISPRPNPSHLSTNQYRHSHNVTRHAHNSSGPLLTPFGHSRPPPSVQVLFTFPLANQCSLVVLKEDATYVRGVVDQLGLLPFSPEEVWSTLYNVALKRPGSNIPKKQLKSAAMSKSMLLDKLTFVECMHETIQNKAKASKKRSSSGLSKSLSDTRDVLANFFRSYDLVQIDQVSLNELMGGLTLLCGGKKSTKLSFAFSLFDRRQNGKKKGKKALSKPNSLDGEELFLFLRSFLIVTFSCCRQSWDLSDDAVNRYIADTANMVTDDVMRYQWRKRKKERVDFDEFGQWYNEGGYETAPWLELLDLTKWVLVENLDALEKKFPPNSPGDTLGLGISDPGCPPAPPDAEVDASFFDDDAHAIMPMDSMDEMDLLLMQQPSQDKEDAVISKLVRSFPYSPKPSPKAKSPPRNSNPLKFHIVIDDSQDGYCFSVSQKRLCHLRHVLLESGLPKVDGEKASKEILAKAYRDDKSNSRNSHYVTKDGFDSAVRRVIVSRNMSVDTQRTLSNLLNDIFMAFDYDGTGKANAFDIACGFTLLCQGKKSDKLEFAFEILDRDKGGFLLSSDVTRYLRSFLLVLVKITSSSSLDSDFVDDVMTSMSGETCDNSGSAISRAVDMGCQWAAQKAMKGSRGIRDTISFDDFADWYTRVGHSNIPWVELLDLNKWIISTESR